LIYCYLKTTEIKHNKTGKLIGNRFVLFLFLPYFEWNIHYLKIYSFPFFDQKLYYIMPAFTKNNHKKAVRKNYRTAFYNSYLFFMPVF